MRHFFALLVSYLMASPLTSLISLYLRKTEWLNIMTYIWWIGAGFVWIAIATFVLIVVAVLTQARK